MCVSHVYTPARAQHTHTHAHTHTLPPWREHIRVYPPRGWRKGVEMNMWICATRASERMKVKTGLEGLLLLLRPPNPPLPPTLSFPLSLFLSPSPVLVCSLARCILHPVHAQPCTIRFDVCGIDAERGRVPVYWLSHPSPPTTPPRATSDFLVNTYVRIVRDASSDDSGFRVETSPRCLIFTVWFIGFRPRVEYIQSSLLEDIILFRESISQGSIILLFEWYIWFHLLLVYILNYTNG